MPDHSSHKFIVEYHGDYLIPKKKNIFFTVSRTQDTSSGLWLLFLHYPRLNRQYRSCLSYPTNISFYSTGNIFTALFQDSVSGFSFCSCNILAVAKNFGLGTILLSCLASELQKNLHRKSKSGQFSGL
jgi:hypothetical protein